MLVTKLELTLSGNQPRLKIVLPMLIRECFSDEINRPDCFFNDQCECLWG